MALDFRVARLSFDPTTGRVQNEPGSVNFATRVIRADCALRGYNFRYNNGDHELLMMEIEIKNKAVNGTNVTFNVDFLLRDSSGNIDDPYSGFVEVLVIADVS